MKKKVLQHQQVVLKALAGKVDEFYLAGGTALSLFYFQHRLSFDLDFFTREFEYRRVEETVRHLAAVLGKEIGSVARNLGGLTAQMAVYAVHFTAHDALKIDFVEDTVELVQQTKTVDGIRVLSLEDIYLRKLYALAGMVKTLDETGRGVFVGGRADAKDFYDVYCLSHTFMPLSAFLVRHCDKTVMESIVRWYRTFDRMAMMDGVLNLETTRPVDFKAEERHFRQEVDKLIDLELGGI